jgi:hypothetical protein
VIIPVIEKWVTQTYGKIFSLSTVFAILANVPMTVNGKSVPFAQFRKASSFSIHAGAAATWLGIPIITLNALLTATYETPRPPGTPGI